MRTAPAPRAAVAALPAYRPGRSAGMAMADHGLDSAVKLASNELPLLPLPSVAKAIEAAISGTTRYPDHRATELRRALAERLGVDTARVTVGCGSVGLLQQLALAYAGPGDEVVYGWPSFEAYPVFVGTTGATPVPVPLRRQTLDAEAIAAALTPRTRLVLVANPNNPTGTALRRSDLLSLADALPDRCLLVVDEAYREFVTGADVPDALALLGDRPDVVVLRTFSKAHGLAALRIGYLVGDPEVVAALDKVLVPFAVNGLGQAAALASLAAPDELADRVGGVVAERGLVSSSLRSAGWMVPDAQANFVWLPAGDAAQPLATALERSGVVTRPFPGLGVRVTIGTAPENDRFITALAAVADRPDVAATANWLLPVGAEAGPAATWVDRLDAVECRLHAHATLHRFDGLTEPDPGGTERWHAGQVWAHLAEFGRYWLAELDHVLDDPCAGPVPFGRTKRDPVRLAAIEGGRRPWMPVPPTPLVDVDSSGPSRGYEVVRAAIDALRGRLLELTVPDWGRVGHHETLGDLTVAEQLQHFHVGHYEEHADQLDTLVVQR